MDAIKPETGFQFQVTCYNDFRSIPAHAFTDNFISSSKASCAGSVTAKRLMKDEDHDREAGYVDLL